MRKQRVYLKLEKNILKKNINNFLKGGKLHFLERQKKHLLILKKYTKIPKDVY